MAARTAQWVDDMRSSSECDIRIVAREGHRSPTVSAIMLPDGMTSGRVTQLIAEHGVTVGTGYGKLKEAAIRIGHMGDHTVRELTPLLAALDASLAVR